MQIGVVSSPVEDTIGTGRHDGVMEGIRVNFRDIAVIEVIPLLTLRMLREGRVMAATSAPKVVRHGEAVIEQRLLSPLRL